MGIRSVLAKPLAKVIVRSQKKWSADPAGSQSEIFNHLLQKASKTSFGSDHRFNQINSHNDFVDAVPIRDYEGLKPYVDRILEGQRDILWPGMPTYFAKTSGTTSGTKYIPITTDSIPNHINSARDALLSYVHNSGNSKFLDGNLIFLSGSPEMYKQAGVHVGRLSGIVNHHVPGYLRSNQLPSYAANCIEDWEEKLDAIIAETLSKPMSLISGIPPWVQMYFDKIMEKTGKHIKDVFPEFSLFVHGGVNFEPYKDKLFESIGQSIDSIETYPSSEGFIAYQDTLEEEGLLLLTNSGIYFEFIPAEKYFNERPPRISVEDVEVGVNYAVIISSNAGLWGYSLGDTVKFTSIFPHRLVVTGRIKHFISAFGEHVIAEEVEGTMKQVCSEFPESDLVEFSVAPNVTPDEGLPLHEWYVEFGNAPNDLAAFENALDLQLQKVNSYYFDLISGGILRPLKIQVLKKNSFRNYMKSQGKLGGQNKVPRLSNDRAIADQMQQYIS